MPDLIIISGCSGGGKSTLIDHLRQSGETVIAEPGRRIIAAEQAQGGSAVPWRDMGDFLNRTLALSRTDLEAARTVSGRLFLDRGLIDAAVALEHLTGAPAEENIGNLYFYRTVFLAPPWPEIYRTDPDRRHGLAEGIAEYERLAAAYPRLGYEVRLLPKTSIAERAAFVLAVLAKG